MMRLRHPNIVLFLGVGLAPPSCMLVMEYLNGGTLYQALRKPADQPKDHMGFFHLAVGIARGMAYLHHRKIIHRDLKSPNVMLGESGTVKITDFGLSVFTGSSSELELTGETGTYRWMAPEIIRHLPYGTKADVFSYGVMLWELLTHRIPWELLNPVQAAVAVAVEGRRLDIPEATPAVVRRLIQTCWDAKPDKRPSFELILTQLEEMLSSLSTAEIVLLDNMTTYGPDGPKPESDLTKKGRTSSVSIPWHRRMMQFNT